MSNLPEWRFIRQDDNCQWFGSNTNYGPWHPIPAPQPPERLFSMPAPAPEPPDPSISDRLGLAYCRNRWPGLNCQKSCTHCRDLSAAVAHEVAAILRERHGGSSTTADWLDGVGCHQQGEG